MPDDRRDNRRDDRRNDRRERSRVRSLLNFSCDDYSAKNHLRCLEIPMPTAWRRSGVGPKWRGSGVGA